MTSHKETLQNKLKKWGASEPRFIEEHGGPATIAFMKNLKYYTFSYTRRKGDHNPNAMGTLAYSLLKLIDLDIRGIFPFERVAKDFVQIGYTGGNNLVHQQAEGAEHYRVLELSPTATDEEVKQRFRDLATMYHPDRAPSDAQRKVYEEKMSSLNSAYTAIKKIRESGQK